MKKKRLNNTAASYYRDMLKLLKDYKADVDRELVPLVKRLAPETPIVQDSWIESITAVLDRLRAKWEGQTGKFRAIASKFVRLGYNNTRKSIEVKIDMYGESQRMREYLDAAVAQNVSLIKSIGVDYHDQVTNAIIGNMRQGMRSSKIIEELSKQYGIRERHARFIARDQTAKAQGELARVRQLDVGYEYFKWETSRDERVRDEHHKLANQDVGYGKGVYRWDDLPEVDGKPLYPGSDYQCRCTARPVRNIKAT